MDIKDALREGTHKSGREQPHIAGEDDKIDLGGVQCSNDLGVVILASATFGGNDHRVQPTLLRRFDPSRLGDVRDHDPDLSMQLSRSDVVSDGEKVGAASGEQDAEAAGSSVVGRRSSGGGHKTKLTAARR